ncbi:Hypothetical protein A7982_09101 [Minicystis rosea]|nr:Hypothetical protein A7982_09101 [Minicystis rosea]
MRRRDEKDSARTARRLLAAVVWGGALAVASIAAVSGCNGWDPRQPFERNAPEVDEAIHELDAGKPQNAETLLEQYLGTGPCRADAGIAVPDAIRQKHAGSFDLGLTLFQLGERYGHRFGDEEGSDGGADEEALMAKRSMEIDCALAIVHAIAQDPKVPTELRARARYLAGNLELLRRKYEEAVKEYDQALALVPGILEEAGGDGIGRDAAWNRAIALRRQQELQDAGTDAPDASDGDDGSDGSDAADGSDGSDAADASDGNDAGPDSGDGGDGGDGDGGPQDGGGDGGQDGGGDGGPQDGGGSPNRKIRSRPRRRRRTSVCSIGSSSTRAATRSKKRRSAPTSSAVVARPWRTSDRARRCPSLPARAVARGGGDARARLALRGRRARGHAAADDGAPERSAGRGRSGARHRAHRVDG